MPRRVYLTLALLALTTTVACFVQRIPGRYCTVRTDCTEAGYEQCDTSEHTCVPDTVDLGTNGNNDLSMIGCSTSAMCPPSEPTCSPAQVCSACSPMGMSADCSQNHSSTPLCGPNGGCVQCLTKDNCDMLHQTCNAMNTCAPCVNNSDCTSGICNAGTCADEANVLYVNNATGSSCTDTGAGSFTIPFCTVQKGLNAAAASSKPLVVFAGTYAENLQAGTALNGGNDYVATVVGIGSPMIKPTSAGPALNVAGTASKQVTTSFDGFVFDGSTLADGSDDIDCAGTNAGVYSGTVLTLTRSTIKGASGIGLLSGTRCTVTLDADIFTANKGGGISLAVTDFLLTNLLLHDNGGASSSFGGVYYASAGETGKMTMFNLTVVDNTAMTGALASGILCTATPTSVTNTLILGNMPATTEVTTTCHPDYSAFIGGMGSNNEDIPAVGCAVTDLLVDPANGNFRPKTGGTKPCTLIDQGTNTNAPSHDLDGTPRPQPASGTDDIGCYEFKN